MRGGDKAERDLRYAPRMPLDKSMRVTYELYKTEELLD